MLTYFQERSEHERRDKRGEWREDQGKEVCDGRQVGNSVNIGGKDGEQYNKEDEYIDSEEGEEFAEHSILLRSLGGRHFELMATGVKQIDQLMVLDRGMLSGRERKIKRGEAER